MLLLNYFSEFEKKKKDDPHKLNNNTTECKCNLSPSLVESWLGLDLYTTQIVRERIPYRIFNIKINNLIL